MDIQVLQFLTAQLHERTSAVREFAAENNIPMVKECLSHVTLLHQRIDEILNERNSVDEGGKSCEHEWEYYMWGKKCRKCPYKESKTTQA